MRVLLYYLEASIVGGVLGLIYIAVTALFGSRIHKNAKRLVWLLIVLSLALPMSADLSRGLEILHIILPTKQIGILSVENTEGTPDLVTQLELEADIDAAREQIGLEPVERSGRSEYREPIINVSAIRKPLTTGMIMTWIWLSGIVIFLLYHLLAYGLWHRKTFRQSMTLQRDKADCKAERILKITEEIARSLNLKNFPAVRIMKNPNGSPFTLGLWHHTIILPAQGYEGKDLYYILKHELIHCKNRDVLVKGIVLCVNAMHWFNPLAWMMRTVANQEMELICDEEVLQDCSKEERREYSEVIMSCISGGKNGPATLTTTYVRGTRFIKQRFRQIFDTCKRKTGMVYAVGMLCAAVCLSGFVQIEEVLLENEGRQSVERDYGEQVRADIDGDGVVEVITVSDYHREAYASTTLRVTYKNGDSIWIEYPGWWSSYMVTGDLNGDGDAEIVLFKEYYGSNVGAGDVKVLYEEDGELKEYTAVLIQNPALKGRMPVSFHMHGDLPASCLGTNIIEKDGKTLLRLLYLGDDYYDGTNTYDGIKYIDCSYTEEGWYIEDFVEIDVFFGTDLWDEILDYSFIYD